MKTMFALALSCLFLPLAHADTPSLCVYQGKDISSDADAIITAVAAQPTCWEATRLAESCEWGSSIDVQIAGTASEKCGAELKKNKPTKADSALLTSMFNACNAKWAKKEGTMYLSFNAFCQLKAVEWMVNLTSENN
jgi:hypothetical protein